VYYAWRLVNHQSEASLCGIVGICGNKRIGEEAAF
jgi:hypothetical protein